MVEVTYGIPVAPQAKNFTWGLVFHSSHSPWTMASRIHFCRFDEWAYTDLFAWRDGPYK